MTQPFKILAADKLADEGLAYIRAQDDAELTDRPGISEQELASIVGTFDGLIVRSGVQVSAKVFAKSGQLKAVARAGVGVDNIDLSAATEAGVLVMNSAEASTVTTAEHAFALMLALARHIGPAYKTMTEGRWERQAFQGIQLAGKTLGIVGFGRIGQAVAQRALAFDMKVIAHDPFINTPTMLNGTVKMYRNFTQMLPHADVVSFHVPLNNQTRGMLDAQAFSKYAKKGLLVVNASRGGIVDEQALLVAIDKGQCGGAALDVFSTEPPPADNGPGGDPGLRNHPKILTTPHLGASTIEAQEAVSTDAAVALMEFLRGHGVRGAVNVSDLRMDLDPLQQRFVDLAQRMAHLVNPMLCGGIMGVTLELAGEALTAVEVTIERMALIGLLQPHMDARLNLVNVRHLAERRGIHLRTVHIEEQQIHGPQVALDVECPDRTHRIVGCVYSDMQPRVVEINGYRMDMIPAGNMILISNDDRPGMIGVVGTEFGNANVNIADMTLSRRDKRALMLLNVDDDLPQALIDGLAKRPGILNVAVVRLPKQN
ncbi:MAG: phosphoglycerate dehydrogenase [Phycisphaeraceae bacterium]|nr:phosphoglycerate dehydrogenase [Phycisphaeraceae bacterium]